MKFKDLTDEDKQFLLDTYNDKTQKWDDRMDQMKNRLNKSERTVRKWLVKLGIKERVETESPQYIEAKKKKINKNTKRFIITWAQNNTPVHEMFLRNIEAYAEEINADIHVIAGRYKNPTSVFTDEEKNNDYWHRRVLPYLDAARHDLHKHLSIMSDIKIQPTAVNPMTGLESISRENSCIFGSPKVQMITIPVLDNAEPKMMMTTGACTYPNYTDSKAGKKGEFHHTFGFVVVEIKDDNTFFARQVTADDDGSFRDLFYDVRFEGKYEISKFQSDINHIVDIDYYDVKEGESVVSRINEIEACILGDLHYGMHDQTVLDATHNLLRQLKPEHVILHDVFDGYSISHHQIKDPFVNYAKEVHNTNNLKLEIDNMLDGLEDFEDYNNVVIVRSNHDDFLDRWLKNEDWKKQPTAKNSVCYMEYSAILLKQYADDPSNVKGVIPHLINERYPNFICLNRKEGYKVGDWELGYHGDNGSNGSKGSILQFRRLNTKCVVGHYHSPSRYDGALSVGTSTKLKLGYNEGGASSWMQAHVIIHKNGKAQHIIFNNGEFTTMR